MSMRMRVGIVAAWILSVLAAGAWAHAQVRGIPPANPTILSGMDLGFRVDTYRGTTPVGRLVVRVNGQWVEAEFGMSTRPLTGQ